MADVIDFTKELNADDILGAKDSTLFKTVVPEWGGTVYFKAMSAQRSMDFQRMLEDKAQRAGMFVRMFQECACNSAGEQLFSPQHIEGLRKKNVGVFLRLQNALMQLNGMIQPDKSWSAVNGMLIEAGVDAAAIALVKAKWDASETVQLIKND